MVTRQSAWEDYGLRTFVYRKGYRPFEHDGLVKLVVRCPETFVKAESEWLTHEEADGVFERLVLSALLARKNLPKPKDPPRFHQTHDYRSNQ